MRQVIACHCRQCRKTSGHHVAATSAKRTNVAIEGAVTWFASSDRARRGFCGTCGANLSIFAGTIDGDTGLKLAGHIYCADKGDYYDLADGLPQAAARDPNLTTQ